ncbi:MAG: Bax inhibitor-1/YccA family protein [Acidimicrobiia bacterium]|nr:Bax inhibitor-1/YccA family protein [Acidimicrobiia bacterium]
MMPTTRAVTSGNPALSTAVVETYLAPSRTVTTPATMTVGGTAMKTLVLLAVLIAGGAWGWASATEPVAVDLGSGYGNTTVTIPGGFWLASFGALFVGIFAAMNPQRAGILGIIYAALQGYCLGAISAAYEAQTEGIVGAAVVATVAVFVVALFLYLTRIIKPTRKLAFGVTAGIGGLCLLYLFVGVMRLFDWGWLYSDQFQAIGAIVSLIAVVLAALALTLDFATIETGTDTGAPKLMEWYSAWGLMVTLIWLYITLLRLLAFLARER